MKRLYLIALVIGCLLALGLAVFAYLGISTSLHAERSLHAVNLMTVVADNFVRQEKRWPNSWNELRSVKFVDAPSMYSWPHDFDAVHELVVIEFDTDIATIASQSIERFDKITPIGACYPYKDYGFVESLLQAAKDATAPSDTSL